MQIQHKEANNRGMFFIEEDGEIVAEIVYASGGNNTIIIEHTEVDESLRGKNIGYQLVKKIADHARSHGLKVIPVCTFAKAIFDKQVDWTDLTTGSSPSEI